MTKAQYHYTVAAINGSVNKGVVLVQAKLRRYNLTGICIDFTICQNGSSAYTTDEYFYGMREDLRENFNRDSGRFSETNLRPYLGVFSQYTIPLEVLLAWGLSPNRKHMIKTAREQIQQDISDWIQDLTEHKVTGYWGNNAKYIRSLPSTIRRLAIEEGKVAYRKLTRKR